MVVGHFVMKFPFMGSSLSGKCDLFEQHTDSLLQPHSLRYWEILMIDECPGCIVATSKISKRVEKCVTR